MSEVGIDISSQRSKSVMEYAGQVHFGYLVPVCAEAEKGCPSFPGLGEKMLWPFEDPAAATGTEEEILQKFRQIRDQISTRVKNWLEEQKDTL
jgi:arsenate reductase